MSGVIGYAVDDGVGYFKLGGELRHDSAAPLEALIERLFENQPSVRGVVIDLNELSFMDSTVIGLLASIARALMAHQLPPATIFSTSPEINELLRSLCLDEVFTLIDHPTDQTANPLQLQNIDACGQCSPDAILKAHEVLIELNEANRIAFQPVVDLFRAEIEAHHKET